MEQENGKPLQNGTTASTTEEELDKDSDQKEQNEIGEAQAKAKKENDEEAKSDSKKDVDEKEETKPVPQAEADGGKETESNLKKEADGKEEAKSEPKEEANGKEEAKSEPKEDANGKEEAKSELKKEADGKEEAKSEPKEEADGKEEAKSEPKENANGKEEAKSELKKEADGKEEAKPELKEDANGKEEAKSELRKEADEKEEAKSELKKEDDKEEAKCDSIEEATKESEKENKTSCSKLEAETTSDIQVTQEVGGTGGTENEQGEGSGAIPSSPEEWLESPTGEDSIGPESPTASESSLSDVPQSPTGPPPPEEKKEEKKKEKPSEPRVSAPARPRGPRAQNRKAIMDKFGGAATGPAPLFRNAKAAGAAVGSVRNMLLEWCRAMTRNYEHVDIQNFSSSWSSGMAFCALIHKFFPDAFDYSTLDPKKRRENFTLAFSTAENLADCAQLLEVDDMVRLSVPDSKCVYTYIQELYRSLVQKGLVKTKKK